MEAALVGFTGSGISTLFEAVAGPGGGTAGLSGGRGKLATIAVPDPRLWRLSAICKPKKTTPATVRLRDIPGLPRSGGDAAANVLASAREVDCLVGVLGAYAAADPAKTLAAERIALVQEWHLADLGLIENRADKRRKASTKPTPTKAADLAEAEALQAIVAQMAEGKPFREIALPSNVVAGLADQGILGRKPALFVENVAEGALATLPPPPPDTYRLAASLEREAAELPEADRKEMLAAYGVTELAGPRLLRAIYQTLGCISFFTIGPDEVKAWTLKSGQNAVAAASTIHTDIGKGFVRAKVGRYEDVDATGSEDAAKKGPKVRTEGKEYVVRDGDILEILTTA